MARCGILALLFLAVASTVSARDVYLDWHITWVWAAPDGFGRPLIGINNAWPCPLVEVDLGDRLIVDVHNDLGNQSTSIHWHGFRQYSTGTMDGAVGATQCGIPPGGHMRYDFVADRSGTYWYHSHVDGQYPDGLRGPLLVRDPSPPFEYDGEFTLTLTDYYHEQMPYLIDQYAASTTADRPAGFEPLPDRTLINDTLHTTAHVEPGKTYLVHLICVGAWPGHVIVFDDHEVTVVEVDGVFVEPYKVTGKQIRLATGQRFGVLIRTKDNADRNYAIWDATDINMMFVYENRTIPEGFNPNATAWLVYDETKPLPPAPDFGEFDPNTDFVDDVIFVPIDHEALLEPVDQQIILESAAAFHDGTGRFIVNNVTYVSPDTPTLYAGLLAGASSAADPDTYGQVNPIVVEQGQVVEVVINNHHNNLHPWHLHGHQYQVVQRSAVDGGFFTGYFQNVSSTPVRRDTIMVQNNGHAVIRFRADNPGVWLLHCHIEFHMVNGMAATVIEAPSQLQQIPAPSDLGRGGCSGQESRPVSGVTASIDISGSGMDMDLKAGSAHVALDMR